MKRVKEFTIKLLEDNKAPIVEIDGEKLSRITNLKVKYNSDNVMIIHLTMASEWNISAKKTVGTVNKQ